MSSPVFNAMGRNDFVARFEQFRKTFQGNPQEQVQQLLNTGKVTQAQVNQAMQIAQQFKQLFR